MTFTLAKIAEHIGAEVKGDGSVQITGVAPLHEAIKGELTFLANPKFKEDLKTCTASAIIVASKFLEDCHTNALVAANTELAFAHAAELFAKRLFVSPGIHESAVVHPDARVDESAFVAANAVIGQGARIEAGTYIGPGCVIGTDAHIQEGAILHANVTLYHDVIVGKRVIVHAGAVVGSDGYGYAKDGEQWIKIPQLGRVVLGDDVEVGANVTIDRGAIRDTVIKDGVKLDNLVHIAHNVQIGENTMMTGMVGVAGSTKIGKNCAFGGKTGVNGHINIADNCMFTAMSMVTHSISEPGLYSSGLPAQPNKIWRKNVARLRRLEQMESRLKTLEARLRQLENEEV